MMPTCPIPDCLFRSSEAIAPRVKYITKLKENVTSLTEGRQDLINKRESVRRQIQLAERRGSTILPEVKTWLERVETFVTDVNQIEDEFKKMKRLERVQTQAEADLPEIEAILAEAEFNHRKRCLGNWHPKSIWYGYRLGKRVLKKLKRADELKNIVFNNVADESLLDRMMNMPSTSIVGMQSAKEKILRCLEEDKVGVIGIFGMGGVGKTTLLKEINKEYCSRRKQDFDVVIFVVVSQEPNLEKIQKNIADQLGLSLPGDQDQNAAHILSVLSRKKTLMLMDDVWKRLDLNKVGIPNPSINYTCKLIFTTRSEETCGQMEAREKIKVECLMWEDAWKLFREKVGEDIIDSHLEIEDLAKAVAKNCGGLPLALIAIGRAMASKKTPQEWSYAITVLRKSSSAFPGMKDEVLSLLKFTYDNLDDDTTRSCFLYCSLYPEDCSFYREEIIGYWIGEGFMDECDDLDEALNKGHNLIGTLKAACLLEDGDEPETKVKMHDVIRNLALWIACESGEKKEKFLVQAGVGLREAPRLERWNESTRVSLMDNQLEELMEAPTCLYLKTLMLQGNDNLKKISNTFFQSMPLLTVLDLSLTRLGEFPTGIGKLVNLRYLNLSLNDIKTLPGELVNLVKLEHLDLSYTELQRIPHKVIAKLSRIQVLNLHGSTYSHWKVGGSDDDHDDKSGIDLAELEGLKQLTSLGISINNVDTLNKFTRSQIFTTCTRSLTFCNDNALTCFQLSSTFENMERLECLHIHDCGELEKLEVDEEVEGANCLLPNLDMLYLKVLNRLKTLLVPYGCLQKLRVLFISECNELKNITWVLHLPSLQTILLNYCDGIEEIIGDEVDMAETLIAFPRLKRMELVSLPELKIISRYALAFPSLEEVTVFKCPKLKERWNGGWIREYDSPEIE